LEFIVINVADWENSPVQDLPNFSQALQTVPLPPFARRGESLEPAIKSLTDGDYSSPAKFSITDPV